MRSYNISRLLLSAGAVAVIVALLALPQISDANNAASVVRGEDGSISCGAGSGVTGFPVPFMSTTDWHSVATNNGNTKLTCQFTIPEAYRPAQAVVNTDFGCNTFLGATWNTRAVSSPDGNLTLTCQINGSN
jgi:hypothetical protein